MVSELSFWDYVIFIATLIVPLIVGFYHNFTGGNQRTIKEHMLGDGQMTIIPVAFSLMASFMSAITMLGLPAEVMQFSTQFVVINFGYVIGTPIACYLILPVFFEKKYLSLFQYLEVRFNRKLRLLVSNLFTIEMVLYMGIVLYAPALALSAVTNLPKWTTIIVIGIVCTIYCVCGGIKAVLYNDIFQGILMFVGLLLILFGGLSATGGWSKVIELNYQNNRIQFFNMSFSIFERHTIWTQLIGGTFLHLSVFSINQTQIQRLITLPTLKKSQLSLWLALPITMLLSFTTCLTGLVMYAYFYNCDPVLSKKVNKPDQMIPLMMVELFDNYPSIPGLICAAIFAGAISSVASFVNSLAAVTLEEVVRPIFLKNKKQMINAADDDSPKCLNNDKLTEKDNADERRAVIYSKILGVLYGLLCLFIAYLCEKIDRLLETCLALFGIAGGPMLAVFILGISSRKVTSNGAICGFLIALFFGIVIGFGPILTNQRPTLLSRSIEGCENKDLLASLNITSSSSNENKFNNAVESNIFLNIFKISYMWICPLTACITWIVALLYSRLFPEKDLIVGDDLLMPILRKKNKNSIV